MTKTKKILSVILSVLVVLSLTAFLSFAAETPTYIASIGISQDGSSGSTGVNDCKSELSGHTIIDRDLNDGAGGDYVYMGYKTTTDPSKAITGILFRVGENPPDRITDNGKAYFYLVGKGETNTASEGGYIDLNAKAGGDYIYMYVTRDPSYGAPLTAITVDENSSKTGYETATNNSGSVIDLNQEAGGKYLYLHYKRFSETVKSTYHYLDANGNRTNSTQSATVKNHLETMTKVPSYPTSVTYDGRTFAFKGWREDNTAGVATVTSPSATYITGDKTYRAVYSANVKLSYDANGGSGAPSAQSATQYINAGSSSVAKQSVQFTISKNTYTHPSKCFIGLSSDKSATTAAYQPGGNISISSNTTLYAVYADHSYSGGICDRCGAYIPDAVAALSKNGTNVFVGATLDAIITEAEKCTADDKAVVTILQDIDLGSNYQQIDSGVFTLDLNGLEIKSANTTYGALYLSGASVHVTLRDSRETGKITGAFSGIDVRSSSTLTVNDGTISGANYGMFTMLGGTVTINGGTISGVSSGVRAYERGEVTINGGTISGRYGVEVQDIRYGNELSVTVNINGGTINGAGYAVYCYSEVRGQDVKPQITISGGTISGGETNDIYLYEAYATPNFKLTVGEDGTGATFPGGIKLCNAKKLNASLDEGAAYWAGDTMLSVADDATEITDKGDITVKAVCTHESFTKQNYVNNGRKHTYTRSCCKTTATEDHSFTNTKCVCGARDHDCVYTNGFCEKGCYQPAELKDGYYQISNGGQMFWFAEYINTVDRTANAKLTADINLENRAWTPIGSTGEGNNNFRGHFDGQGYTITGLYAEGGRSGLGFFGEVRLGTVENFTIYGEVKLIGKYDYVGGVIGSAPGINSDVPGHNGATIRNITSYVNVTLGEGSHGSNRVGGFIGYANHETLIENCSWYGTLDLGPYRAQDGVGGLVGKANDNSAVNIRNCGAYGTIKTSYQSGSYNSFDTIYIGGIVSNSVSSAQTNIENTLWAGNIINETNLGEKAHISAFGTLNGIGSVTNCYALDNAPYITTNGTHDSYITTVTDAQLASGEVAYKLGTAWGQTIGTDNYPILGGAKVYYGYADCEATEMTYANTPLSETVAAHSYENGYCTVCDGYEPPNGSGTEADPYKIGNAGQMYWFAAQVNGGNISAWAELTDNIVVNENVLKADGTLNEGTFRAWTPIGNSSTKYQGSFDGKGFTVSGLYFNNSSTYYVGLIGYSDRGTIKNTGVIDSYFSAKQYIGAIVGWNSGGNVTNCFNTGSIVSDYVIGGVVGINYTNSTITNCYNTGTLIGKGSVGGVVGSNYQTVENCYNTGRLIISGESRVGGVVADNNGTITHCYNTGSVNGTGNVGGVVGENDGTVTNCYNVGSVDGTGNVGGVAGDNSEVVTNCYYDSTVYNGNAIGYNGDTATNVLGKTTSEFASGEVAYLMQEKETKHIWGQNVDGEGEKEISPVLGGKKVYIVFNCQNEPASFSNTEGQNSGHSYENGFCTACNSYEPATGEGTESDPYKISNAGQLYWFSVKVGDGYRFSCAELTNSITVNTGDVAGCGGIKAEEWLCWNTIGKTSNLSYYKGTFDGKGFTISGLYFNESDTDYAGLFGYVDSGTIKNVGIVNSYLNGNDYVGGVAGYSSGSITNCYYTGSIGGSSKIGGIVGSNFGVVENCCYTGSISGNHNIGGVVGYNDNTVVNCYATPNIIGKLVSSSFVGGTSIGGVVGSNNGAVTNCYSNGSNNINRGDAVGSVVGYNIGQVSHCYYDSKVCKDNAFGSGSGDFWDVEGKTTEEFASGEVAYLLGDAFGQDLDNGKPVQEYPTFTGAKVYQVLNCKNEVAKYSNTNETLGHDWSGNDGICAVCDLTAFTAVNGAVFNCESGIIFGLDAGITSVDSYFNILVDGAEWEYELGIFDQFGSGTKAILKDGDNIIAEYTILIYGDINGDSWYDGEDAFLVNLIVKGMLKQHDLPEYMWMAADCNHDGEINETDVDLLMGAGVRRNDIDQNSSFSELKLQAAYIEYMSLIDQSAGLDVESDEDTDDTTTPDTNEPETPDETEELTFSIVIIKIFTFIRKVLNLVFSFIVK